ncbi:hypothetical protein ACFO3O_19355 [Dokdonia ponticola]|uniref:Secreted protein n=1 Tax=Dokdonia ponticola TaxID=2041041 RepID=A0ABV9I2Z4_9FLAO
MKTRIIISLVLFFSISCDPIEVDTQSESYSVDPPPSQEEEEELVPN